MHTFNVARKEQVRNYFFRISWRIYPPGMEKRLFVMVPDWLDFSEGWIVIVFFSCGITIRMLCWKALGSVWFVYFTLFSKGGVICCWGRCTLLKVYFLFFMSYQAAESSHVGLRLLFFGFMLSKLRPNFQPSFLFLADMVCRGLGKKKPLGGCWFRRDQWNAWCFCPHWKMVVRFGPRSVGYWAR